MSVEKSKIVPKRAQVLILDYIELPNKIKKEVKEWLGFQNDIFLEVRSEFDIESWTIGMSEVEKYWEDQKNENNFKGTIEEFIKEYNLAFDIWFIEQKFDLNGIDKVFIRICW